MTFRTFVRPLFVALSLAFASTAAAPAFADDAGGKSAEHAKGKGKNKEKRGKGKEQKFPVDGSKFEKRVDNRIEHAKDKLSGALSKHGVAEADKKRILKQFDDGAALVRAAAKRAAKDGLVTKEEAKDVRGLVKNLRKQLKDALPKKSETPKDV
jgi:hypothetical protein